MAKAIIVESLGKRFKRYHADRPNTIMAAVLGGFKRLKSVDVFWALRNISFAVEPGEMLGVIGSNGAGKSTLLHLVGGIGQLDEGSVEVHGKIGALLDLGASFHPDLTGRENAFVSASIGGLSRREVKRHLPEIINFAELESFIDNPIRTYSTGMKMRLAFAVAIHTNPSVLLIDEFLSVGDMRFQSKCLDKIRELQIGGCAVLFVSHNINQVKSLCDTVLWLKSGAIAAIGPAEDVTQQYAEYMRENAAESPTSERQTQVVPSSQSLAPQAKQGNFQSKDIVIESIRLIPGFEIESGQSMTLEIGYLPLKPIHNAHFGISISQSNGNICFDTHTAQANFKTGTLQEPGTIRLVIERLDLAGGQYFIDVGIYEATWSFMYDYYWHMHELIINSSASKKGILNPPLVWQKV
ncbi:MAG: ABC transporter ATP-binding protein [Verrucomicrobiota bacterium]